MNFARVLVAVAAGALLSAALPSAGAWPLLIALVPLFAFTATAESSEDAFWLGFAFGLGFFTLYVLWLPASFSTPEFFGSFFWLLYPPLLLFLATSWGLVTYAARLLGNGGSLTLFLLPALWITLEWARTQGYFAFPWGTLGYAWLDTPVAQLADTVGVWGLGLLTTTVAALLALPFVPAPRTAYRAREGGFARIITPVLLSTALLLGSWFWGSAKLTRPLPQPNLTAVLVQANVDPFGRLMTPTDEVRVQSTLTRQEIERLPRPPDLVVWPEGAVLAGFEGVAGAQRVQEVQASAPASTFLIGGRASVDEGSFNSAYVIDDGAIIDRYDKYYLVPFGERFPLAETAAPLYRGVFGLFGMNPLASTGQGSAFDALDSPLGRLAAYICYESVFPQVQRAMVRAGAQVLVNITNDAWFSRGDGAEQHYAMGRMRAIETRRYLLRAGNDGITGIVDPMGVTLGQIPRSATGAMTVQFALSSEITPYVRFGHLLLPLLLVWIVCGLVTRLWNR